VKGLEERESVVKKGLSCAAIAIEYHMGPDVPAALRIQ
jgi:hypothetical protein